MGSDKITVTLSGNCKKGSNTCPELKVSGGSINSVLNGSEVEFTAEPPSKEGKIATVFDFFKSLQGYESYTEYDLKLQGCNKDLPAAQVWAWDPYQWSGRLELGYDGSDKHQPWKVKSNLKGVMGVSNWSLAQALPEDSFSNILNCIAQLIGDIKEFCGLNDNGHGYKAFDSGLVPPKLSTGGAIELVERQGSADIGLKGSLDIKFEPLLGFNLKVDVVTAVINSVFPSPLAEPILIARKKIEKGGKTEGGALEGSGKVEIELSLIGRVDTTLGWDFNPGENCLPSKGANTSQAGLSIVLGLKASVDVVASVLIVKFKAGAKLELTGQETGSHGTGFAFSAYATEVNGQPGMAGKGVFTGCKLVYSYYLEAMKKGEGASEEAVTRRKRGKAAKAEAPTLKKEVTGEKTLLKPQTLFDTGQSQQGVTLDQSAL